MTQTETKLQVENKKYWQGCIERKNSSLVEFTKQVQPRNFPDTNQNSFKKDRFRNEKKMPHLKKKKNEKKSLTKDEISQR